MCRKRLLEGFALFSLLPILQTFDNGQTDVRSASILSHPTSSMTEVASHVLVGVPFICEGTEAGLHRSLDVQRSADTLCRCLLDTMLPRCCFRCVVSLWLLSCRHLVTSSMFVVLSEKLAQSGKVVQNRDGLHVATTLCNHAQNRIAQNKLCNVWHTRAEKLSALGSRLLQGYRIDFFLHTLVSRSSTRPRSPSVHFTCDLTTVLRQVYMSYGSTAPGRFRAAQQKHAQDSKLMRCQY